MSKGSPTISHKAKSEDILSTKVYQNAFSDGAHITGYLDRVLKGQSEVYDTPFARGESTKDMLSAWNSVLVSIKDQWPTLYEFEMDLAKKVGPMSVMKPLSERMDDIESYYEGILLPQKPLHHSAVAAVISEFRNLRGLRIRSEQETWNLMKKSTSSGSPYFERKSKVWDKTIPCAVSPTTAGTVEQTLPTGLWEAPAILGWRGQEGGPKASDVKQRVVWMFPFSVNLRELQLYQPFIEQAQLYELVPAWVSMELVDKKITALFDTKAPGDLVVCTDFSKFDQHFNETLQSVSREILSALVSGADTSRLNSKRRWLEEVFPIKYMIPLVYGVGKVKFGKHGMGSGSGGTNCDETLAHRALQYEAAILHGAKLNPNSQCLGDDGILTYPGITVEDVVNAYTSHGLEMNEDKQYASTQDCTYLRRWHHKDYRVDGICAGVYSTMRALGRLRYLERYQNPKYWDAKAVALRQLSIIENVKFHPLRNEFADFCMARDKYRLGVDIPHFLDDIRQIAMEKIDNMQDFLGYTKSLQAGDDPLGGIENWWIIKYLKSK